MGREVLPKNELQSGPDIQRFLEDAAAATAEFARETRINHEVPPAQYCTDRNSAEEDPADNGSVNHGWIVLERPAGYRNARRRPKLVDPEAKKWVIQARGWKGAPLLLGSEIGERLGSTTITYNLIVYLTSQMNLPLVKAVYISSASFSASCLAPLLGEFLADAHLGRCTTVATGSIFYLGGLVLFTLLALVADLRPTACNLEPNVKTKCQQATSFQMSILFLSLTLQTVGSGGIRPCAARCGAEQFDESTPMHQSQIRDFFNWYKACMGLTMIVAVTVVIWIQTDVGWGWGSLVLCITMALSLIAVLSGSSFYRCVQASGSPLTSLVRVVVAAIRKRKLSLPDDPDVLYQVKAEGTKNDLLVHTKTLRWLDKAAILEDCQDDSNQNDYNPWRLCPVHQVEELKKILKMAPVWLCTSISAIVYIQVFTLMTKQALIMDLRVSESLEFPAASMGVFSILTFLLVVPLYDAYLVGLLRKLTGHPRGLTSLQRIGVGMFIGILTMAVSTLLENYRRRTMAISQKSLSGFWLIPQFVLAGLGESFTVPGLLEFYDDETPSRIQGMHKSFVLAALGMGGVLSTALVSIIQSVTMSKHGYANGWLYDDINLGRVDFFYCTLAILVIVVFTVYVVIASSYRYTGKTAALQPGHAELNKTGADTVEYSL